MKRYHVELGMGHTAEVNAEWFQISAEGLTFRNDDAEFPHGRLVAAFRMWDSVITLDE